MVAAFAERCAVFVTQGEDVVLQPVRTTLRAHRGTVPVEATQDFKAVRGAVRSARAQRHVALLRG